MDNGEKLVETVARALCRKDLDFHDCETACMTTGKCVGKLNACFIEDAKIAIEATLSTQAAEIERREEIAAAQEGWHNPVHRVALRAGFILCREYMARFVEGPGSDTERNIATSIRANWIPALGDDPGPPRKMRFDECVTAEDMELGPWEAEDPGLSVEAACYALCAMADLGMTIPDDAEPPRQALSDTSGSADNG